MDEYVHNDNIDSLVGCKIIQGDLMILYNSFTGDPYKNISSMHPRQLKALSDVSVVTGVVYIQSATNEMSSLSFLGNLKVRPEVEGRRSSSQTAR